GVREHRRPFRVPLGCAIFSGRASAPPSARFALRRSQVLAAADAVRTRRSFARLEKSLDVPNLIDIQRRSFEWLTDPETGGLRETIDDITPIEDYTGNLAVDFQEFVFDDPVASIEECREKDLTYARPLTVTV